MRFLLALLLVFSTPAFADLESNRSFDLGIAVSPSFTPEGGYSDSRLRLGVEFAMSFFTYTDGQLVSVEGVTSAPTTSFKLLRVGIGAIDKAPVLTFSPMAVRLQNRLYLAPTFGFGEHPHTIFSVSYELIP